MLSNSEKISIIKRIDFIEVELNDLSEYKGLTYKEYNGNRIIRRNIERIIEKMEIYKKFY